MSIELQDGIGNGGNGGGGSDKQVTLLSITTEPTGTFKKGSKYYNSTTKLIYTATADDVWGTDGETPSFNTIYIYDNNGTTEYYQWDGDNLVETDLEKYQLKSNITDSFSSSSQTTYPSSKALKDGLETAKPNIYDIKLLSQAIADKGWACLSHTTRKDISKSSIPNFYDKFVEEIYNNCDGAVNWEQSYDSGVSAYLYANPFYCKVKNKYYFFFSSHIQSTTDFTNFTEVKEITSDNIVQLLVVADRYIVGARSFIGFKGFFVYDVQEDELVDDIGLSLDFNDRAIVRLIDDKIIFANRQGNKFAYFNTSLLSDLSSISANINYVNGIPPMVKCGNTYYGVQSYGIYSGSSFDNITTKYADWTYFGDMIPLENGISALYTVNGTCYLLTENNSETLFNCPNEDRFETDGEKVYFRGCLIGDITTKTTENITQQSAHYVWASLYCYGNTPLQIATNGSYSSPYITIFTQKKTLTQYTDTINGTDIKYYKYNDWKICIPDTTNDNNLDTVYSYLGYLNYWRIDTTSGSETITLPRNSNLWTMMYVGDDYQDSNLPSGSFAGIATKNEVKILETTYMLKPTIVTDGDNTDLNVEANKIYKWTNTITTLNITSVQTSDYESVLYFMTGSGSITFTAPNTLKWGNGGIAPSLEPNTTYCIAIVNGLAEIDSFATI